MKGLKQDILDALHDATNLDNGRVSAPYFAELLDGILTEQCNMANVSHSGYICHIGKERVFIIAQNIAQAMDKMEEIAGDSVFGYSMESHSSIRVIYCG